MTTKQCSGCLLKKPIEQFSINRSKKGTEYPHSRCNTCKAAYAHNRRHHGTPEEQASMRKAADRYQKSDKFKRHAKNWKLKNAFGITIETFEAMRTAQKDRCDICKQPEKAVSRGKILSLAVDHDHSTGAVRKLLCARCNRMIGLAQDSQDLLLAAIDYLQRHAPSVLTKPEIQNP